MEVRGRKRRRNPAPYEHLEVFRGALTISGSSCVSRNGSNRTSSGVSLAGPGPIRAPTGTDWKANCNSRGGIASGGLFCCVVRYKVGRFWPVSNGQQIPAFIEEDVPVNVTSMRYWRRSCPKKSGRLPNRTRDLADAENSFDELKNQWAWDGFTTNDLRRCQLTAPAVAIAYNCRSLFVRLAHPKARPEAIACRSLLLSDIAAATAGSCTRKSEPTAGFRIKRNIRRLSSAPDSTAAS